MKTDEKIVLCVILQQYADWEAAYLTSAVRMLGGEEFEVKTVSLSEDWVESIGGFRVMPDYTLDHLPEEYEACVLIGGMSWRQESAKRCRGLAEDCFKKGKILGGICDAAGFLGTTGLLNTVNHTANDRDDLKQWAGAAYTGEEKYIARQAVRDKNVITANGTAPLEFAKEILSALHVSSEKAVSEWYSFHKLGYYTVPLPEM